MSVCLITLTVLFCLKCSLATIDLTLPELEYLANHLTIDECCRLVAALHFDSFKLNDNIDIAEDVVPKDVGCLKLLAYWNSAPGEGLGRTHEKLSLRLRQIGKHDLAEWLDSAVLKELGDEINKTAMEFTDNPKSHTTDIPDDQQNLEEEFIEDFTLNEYVNAIFVLCCMLAVQISIYLILKKCYKFYNKIKKNKALQDKVETKTVNKKIYKKLIPS